MLADNGSRVLVHGPECAELAIAADPAEHGVVHALPAGDLQPPSRPGAAAGSPRPNLIAEQEPVELDDPVLILYTSGTTGRPKGAVLTHGNITWNTVNQLAHVDVLSTDVGLCVAPLFHVTGLGQVSMPTLLKGGTVVVVPKFDAGGFLVLIARRRATCFSAVPTMLQMMCAYPGWPATRSRATSRCATTCRATPPGRSCAPCCSSRPARTTPRPTDQNPPPPTCLGPSDTRRSRDGTGPRYGPHEQILVVDGDRQ